LNSRAPRRDLYLSELTDWPRLAGTAVSGGRFTGGNGEGAGGEVERLNQEVR